MTGGWLGRAGRFSIMLFSAAIASPAFADVPHCELESGPARAVAKVIDGETLVLDDGSEVRLIGALPPRALDGGAEEGMWPLEAAAKAELERLALGKSVELAFGGRRTDRYGRLLAHVFVRDGSNRFWLQGAMLQDGHARAYALPGNTACLADLVSAEAAAREARLGLWAHASYEVRSADKYRELLRFRSTYQLVEGRAITVSDVRRQIYLNFGINWREDFTVTVRPRHRRAFDDAQFDFKALEGRRIRVRGWIERRGGPLIEVYHPAQIEILPEHASPDLQP